MFFRKPDRWTKHPEVAVELDSSHPLVSRLVRAILINPAMGLRDVITDEIGTPVAGSTSYTGIKPHIKGSGARIADYTGNCLIWWDQLTTAIPNATAYGRQIQIPPPSYQGNWRQGWVTNHSSNNGTNVTGYYDYDYPTTPITGISYVEFVSTEFQIESHGGYGAKPYLYDGTLIIRGHKPEEYYLHGKYKNTHYSASRSGSETFNGNVRIGGALNTAESPTSTTANGIYQVFYLFDTILDAGTIWELSKQPYALWKRVISRAYSFPATAPSTTSNICIPQKQRWRTKPEGQVEIDRTHPLGEHLVRCVLFNKAYGLNDIVDGCRPHSTSAYATWQALQPTVRGTAAIPYNTSTDIRYGPIGTGGVGGIWDGSTGYPIPNGVILHGYTHRIPATDDWLEAWSVLGPSNGQYMDVGCDDGTSIGFGAPSAWMSPAFTTSRYDGQRLDIAFARRGNVWLDTYLNGRYHATIVDDDMTSWHGQCSIGSDYSTAGESLYLFILDIAPDAEVIEELQRNPFQLFTRKIYRTYSFPAGAITYQYSRPISDYVDGNWYNELGTQTNLYGSINEVTASDDDYIYTLATGSPVTLTFGALNDPNRHDYHKLRYRLRGDGTHDIQITAYSDTTQIAQWTETNVPATWTDYEHTLSEAEAANFSAYNLPRFKFDVV